MGWLMQASQPNQRCGVTDSVTPEIEDDVSIYGLTGALAVRDEQLENISAIPNAVDSEAECSVPV
jgi:hypothetical protein